MREILFRGKRTDKGGWVEGYLGVFKDTTQVFVPFTKEKEEQQKGHIFSAIGGLWHEVDPETVGQFTGFADKNGKRIFEGDVLLVKTEREMVPCTYWELKHPNSYVGLPEHEIIGNVYENPELGKVGSFEPWHKKDTANINLDDSYEARAAEMVKYARSKGLSNGVSIGYHSGQIDEMADFIEEIVAENRKIQAFKEYFEALYGKGLKVVGWHQNGSSEEFDTFFDAAEDEYNKA